jgi:hypothetical protein
VFVLGVLLGVGLKAWVMARREPPGKKAAG